MNLRAAVICFLFTSFIFSTASAKGRNSKKVVTRLKRDISYLASDALEGRRTGSEGERKAADYIIEGYTKAGIPAYKTGYRYPFTFVNGKEITQSTIIMIGGKAITDR